MLCVNYRFLTVISDLVVLRLVFLLNMLPNVPEEWQFGIRKLKADIITGFKVGRRSGRRDELCEMPEELDGCLRKKMMNLNEGLGRKSQHF